MGNINQDILKIIKEAIRLEINGREFFEYAAAKKLANDELEHLKVFGDLFSESLGSDDW